MLPKNFGQEIEDLPMIEDTIGGIINKRRILLREAASKQVKAHRI
jgi:hypothetical protein